MKKISIGLTLLGLAGLSNIGCSHMNGSRVGQTVEKPTVHVSRGAYEKKVPSGGMDVILKDGSKKIVWKRQAYCAKKIKVKTGELVGKKFQYYVFLDGNLKMNPWDTEEYWRAGQYFGESVYIEDKTKGISLEVYDFDCNGKVDKVQNYTVFAGVQHYRYEEGTEELFAKAQLIFDKAKLVLNKHTDLKEETRRWINGESSYIWEKESKENQDQKEKKLDKMLWDALEIL